MTERSSWVGPAQHLQCLPFEFHLQGQSRPGTSHYQLWPRHRNRTGGGGEVGGGGGGEGGGGEGGGGGEEDVRK